LCIGSIRPPANRVQIELAGPDIGHGAGDGGIFPIFNVCPHTADKIISSPDKTAWEAYGRASKMEKPLLSATILLQKNSFNRWRTVIGITSCV
jgi:hypothetical protein